MRRVSFSASLSQAALALCDRAICADAGCRQDMQDQPKFVPQRGTTFFADGRSVRPQVEHTVARGQLDEDDYFYTGLHRTARNRTRCLSR